jgi:hypothetical protein
MLDVDRLICHYRCVKVFIETCFVSVALQSKLGVGRLNLEVSRSHTMRTHTHTHTHTHTGRTPLEKCDQFVSEAAT